MGCAPSKGNNFGNLTVMRKGRMLPPVPQEAPADLQFEDKDTHNSTGSKNKNIKERKGAGGFQVSQIEAQMTPQRKIQGAELENADSVNMNKSESQTMEKNTASLKREKHTEKEDLADKKSGKKTKKNAKCAKAPKRKDKDKDKMYANQKVDFPEPLVKAHQAAYAFLNPSIQKYDIVLGLLEQATQTQVSIQPMVAFMALRYEEIIQGLEEIADEGEKVFKEYGDSQPPPDLLQQLLQYTTQRMRNVCQTVSGLGDSALEEAVEYFTSVSDLLEEKLKIKRAAEARLMQVLTRIEMASLRKPGPEDSALFSEDSGIGAENESLAGSEKRHRRGSCGSTGTNQSTVSSIEYTVSTVGLPRQKRCNQISPSLSLASLNSVGSACTLMPNGQEYSLLGSISLDDGEEDENEEVDRGVEDVKVAFRMKSNSSPVRGENHPSRLPAKRIENPQNVDMTLKMKNAISGRIQFVSKQNTTAKEKVARNPKASGHEWTDEVQSPKRPQTAALVRRAVVKKRSTTREQRSRSAESLRSKGEDPTLLELERTQKNLSQRLQKMSKTKVEGNSKIGLCKQTQGNSPAQSPAINRKLPSVGKDCVSQKCNQKASPPNCQTKKEKLVKTEVEKQTKDEKAPRVPYKATPPPRRNSVKKLIDTFSQGLEEGEGPKSLGPLKSIQRCGVPVLPGLGNVEAVLSSGLTSCRPDPIASVKTDDLDVNNLPPPPLEVLLDNSFENAQSGSAAGGDCASKVGKSPVLKRAAVSQRLRASVQSVTVLPSKGGLPQLSNVISPDKVNRQDCSASLKINQPDVQSGDDQQTETNCLHQKEAKIIPVQQPLNTNSERLPTNSATMSNSLEESSDTQHLSKLSESGPNTDASTVPVFSENTNQPFTLPTGSKGRMLPSTPSTPSSLPRRFQSNSTFKRQPTPPSPASPTSDRTFSTPSSAQRRLPTPPTLKQNALNSVTTPSHSFKAPSPPASPRVQRLSRENSSEDLSSFRTFSNARSVFCPVSPSLFEAQPCSVPKPPQAWASTRVSFLSNKWGGRGRFPVCVQGPRPFVRRTQSDRRPSLSVPQRPESKSAAETFGSEPSICSKGLEDESTTDSELWGSQSDLRATPRSASHPDLCVVGHITRPY
uniref:Photoreceptor cilium actin regulator n=1 Tax=Oryzias latipes TaxID=8090 RepID=A0A3B3HKF0_ORYLA